MCDDHLLMRESLSHALGADPRFSVVAQVGSRAAVSEWLASDLGADVIVLDLGLDAAGVSGVLELMAVTHAARPVSAVVVLSMHDDHRTVSAALRAGARAYVTKNSGLRDLQDALVQVHQSHQFLSPRLLEPMLRGHQNPADSAWDAALMAREKEVLTLVCAGSRLGDIAARWGVSVKTISTRAFRCGGACGGACVGCRRKPRRPPHALRRIAKPAPTRCRSRPRRD